MWNRVGGGDQPNRGNRGHETREPEDFPLGQQRERTEDDTDLSTKMSEVESVGLLVGIVGLFHLLERPLLFVQARMTEVLGLGLEVR